MKNLLALFMLTISLTFGLSQATFATVQDEIDTTTVVEEIAAVEEEVVETTPEASSAAVKKVLLFTKSSNKNLLKVVHRLWVSFYCVLS